MLAANRLLLPHNKSTPRRQMTTPSARAAGTLQSYLRQIIHYVGIALAAFAALRLLAFSPTRQVTDSWLRDLQRFCGTEVR